MTDLPLPTDFALPLTDAAAPLGDAIPAVGLSAIPAVPLELGLPTLGLVALAFILLVAGVAGSVVPVLPSGLLSLLGVLTYWFATGYEEPGLFLLSGLVTVALLAMAVEWLSGAISAKAGGASTRTTVVATVAGFIGLIAFSVPGFLLATAGVVFVLTYAEKRDAEESLRAAGVTLLGMLTSNVLQVLLTAGVLLVMVAVALV